ncbi:hypothetical protein [Cystobacter ferrugineus]|uniref:Uncharacterized protein n=1 Tax=Cystobacter ferrugineus TaxID=83449 RepID=A0A1L9BJC1_9BACT|nr:hypothetical protein [Cystobacter ferrugineus]OJH42343.1 hypothetical protein BON30_03830 [Cystobacter ferrugineus]
MRENIRKWLALGALASVALVYPGCKSESRDTAPQNADSMMPGDIEEGTGGSGKAGTAASSKKAGTPSAAGDAGTSTDAGTGGAGSESMGTSGQGVSGSEPEQLESTGESPSGGVPAP